MARPYSGDRGRGARDSSRRAGGRDSGRSRPRGPGGAGRRSDEPPEDEYVDEKEPHLGKALAVVGGGVVALLLVIFVINQMVGGGAPPPKYGSGVETNAAPQKTKRELAQENYGKFDGNVALLKTLPEAHQKLDEFAFEVIKDLRAGNMDAIEARYSLNALKFYQGWYAAGANSEAGWKAARRAALSNADFLETLRNAFEIAVYESKYDAADGYKGHVLARVRDEKEVEVDRLFVRAELYRGKYELLHVDRKPFAEYYEKNSQNSKRALFDQPGAGPAAGAAPQAGAGAAGQAAAPAASSPGGAAGSAGAVIGGQPAGGAVIDPAGGAPGKPDPEPADPGEAEVRAPLKVNPMDMEKARPKIEEARKKRRWKKEDFDAVGAARATPALVNELIAMYEKPTEGNLQAASQITCDILWLWHRARFQGPEGYERQEEHCFRPENGEGKKELGKVILNWKKIAGAGG
ncbi:MAG: hypothetical protein HY719_00815 [Planctomycetes bacterium]|nr:hypothetical protein [Planctomycetota bacterium]